MTEVNAKQNSYHAYKSSGVEYLGEVPKRWKIRRLKYIATVIAGQSPSSVDVFEYSGHSPFLQGNAEFGDTSPSPKLACESPAKIAQLGDVLLSVRAPVGAINVADQQYGIGRGLCAIRPYAIFNREFAYYALRVVKVGLDIASTGSTYPAVTVGDVGGLPVPVPPHSEQTAIVRYLGHVDSRIQRYISAKERMIELLTEQKQAIINQAVTRGLDPNVSLKPSGVDWLGDVPAHWEIVRFSRHISIAEGQVDPTVEPYASMPLIAPNHLEARTGRLLYQETASEQGAISSKYLCRAGDVIYSKIRPALAKVVVAPTDCLCSADMYPLSPRHSLQANYLFWLLLSEAFTAWSVLESDRVAMPKINRATLNSYHIPVPPIPEQAAIVRHLDETVTNIYTATDNARRQIELMQEYRTRLIADVVTGKLDVRGAIAEEVEVPTR